MHKLTQFSSRFLIMIALSVTFFYEIALAGSYSLAQLQAVPDVDVVGKGRYSVMFWDIYDATLFAPKGSWDSSKPFALSLTYLRDLKGKQIAKASLERIRKQGLTDELKLASWYTQMVGIFPDVSEGERITGVVNDKRESVFYNNDEELGRIRDPKFSKYFFDIWLGSNTEAPDLRRQLLGER